MLIYNKLHPKYDIMLFFCENFERFNSRIIQDSDSNDDSYCLL